MEGKASRGKAVGLQWDSAGMTMTLCALEESAAQAVREAREDMEAEVRL
jgi:hypothetical protein